MPRSVLIVEDDPSVAQSFARAINATAPSLQVSGVAHSVAAAKQMLKTHSPDVCLVDLGLPDGSGLEVIRFANHLNRQTHCLVITVFGDETNVLAAIEAGASGYVLKDSLTSSVAAEVETLLSGGSALSPMVAMMLLKRFRATRLPTIPNDEKVKLSPRESDVLNLIAKGLTYAEVGSVLNIAHETVATHLNNVYQKLAVHSRSEAVYEASRLGLLRI